MWSSKMAARWRGEDRNVKAGNSDFLTSNTLNELVLSRHGAEDVEADTQSCMDQSFLAIFEDSVAPEDKCGTEEESETLLSALTEMLDSVEDDDGTLSPFDTLPDTEVFTCPERRDSSVELSLAERLRPRSKPPNIKVTIKIDGEKKDESKIEKKSPPQQLSPAVLHSKNKRAEAEVEVFTSTSLVNLVNIMHSYCLRLQVEEEGDKLRRNHKIFSQEEVWRYERPTEEIDEEINVVSDDEVTVKETKEVEEGDEDSDNGKLLKSVLLSGKSSRGPSIEKKRVSFGPVQVVSFDVSVENGLNEKNQTSGHTSETLSVPLNSTKALENPADSALELSSETKSKEAEVLLRKSETKAKSLSLQQYRQLCQKRQPLVEKQGNYTTKWPSVSEPPKGLTPIFCLQSQRQNSCEPKTAHFYSDGRRGGADQLYRSQTSVYKTHCISALPRPHPSEARPSTPSGRSGLKRQGAESKIISLANRLPGSKNSSVKKPILFSSDPPNPVLVPLSVSQTSQCTDHSSSVSKVEFINRYSNLDNTMNFQEIDTRSSGTSFQQQSSSIGLKPEVLPVNQDSNTSSQDIKTRFRKMAKGPSSKSPVLCPTTTQIKPSQEYKELQPQKNSLIQTKETKPEQNTPLSPSQLDATIPAKGKLLKVPPSRSPSEEPQPTPQFGCITVDSGIEASDLNSLLEQFEETQANDDRVEPCLESLESLSTSDSPETHKALGNSLYLQISEDMEIPEPQGTEVIISTQQNRLARPKNPPSKTIQIIDPRPLQSRKTHSDLSEIPAALTSPHMCSSVSSDHNYCGPVDHSLINITHHSRASKLKDIYKSTDELQATPNESNTPAECKQRTSTDEGDATVIRAVRNAAKSVMRDLPEEPWTRSERTPFTDEVLSLSGGTAAEHDYGRAAEDKTAPGSLPTPPPSSLVRGRDRSRYRRRSPYSDSSSCSSSSSSSSSASRSPKRQKRRHKRSESSSCSSSPSRSISCSPPRHYRWSYTRSRCSRSRSRSWSQSRSQSRSRSPAPRIRSRQWKDVYSSRGSRRLRREHEIRIQRLKAIDERRVVYVGRIRGSMTHDELRERFSQFGEVECVSLHFRERRDHYGFVTFYNVKDAFAAIDNGSKLRRPDELPFDLCFGGRRQFCNSDYTDLDANRDTDPSPAKSKFENLDFDQLLKQAQRGLKR